MKENLIFLVIFWLFGLICSIKADCPAFLKNYETAKSIVFLENDQNLLRESKDIPSNLNSTLSSETEADIFTVSAMLTAYRDNSNLDSFYENSYCLNRSDSPLSSHSKYRSIDGYGNNLKHPHWGKAYSAYSRFGPKNYYDGIYTMRTAERTQQELPNPRFIVDNVLKKAEKVSRSKNFPNMVFLAFLAYLPLEIGHTTGRKSSDNKELQCCSAGSKAILPEPIRHSGCIPFAVYKDDPFYKQFGVRCITQSRSYLITSPGNVEYSGIRNIASSFVDLSPMYGETDKQSNEIRKFTRGQLILSPAQAFPMTAQGKVADITFRLIVSTHLIFFGTFFLRHHNKLADALANLNPTWDDEKLFQEARKINIGIAQHLLTSRDFSEIVSGIPSFGVESYNENVDASTSAEVMQTAIRFPHFFNQEKMVLISTNGTRTEIPTSDSTLNAAIPEKYFDDSLRGAFATKINLNQYSDELHNKVFKNKEGFGLDLLGIDIQRGRDHGLPTWLQTRKVCGLNANIKCFKDLSKFFPKETIDLLKETYDSVEDIDLIVGGALETFRTLDTKLMGPTFTCLIRDQFRRFTSGDAYWFTHKNNPNPFTAPQFKAIRSVTVNHLICVNSNVEFTFKNPFFIESDSNPKVPCSTFKLMDLSAWIGV